MSDTSTNLGEVTYTRIYDAPRELVFRCMIEPEHLTHFWGPVGVSTPIENITVDPRPGGVFETIMVNDANGEEYPMRARLRRDRRARAHRVHRARRRRRDDDVEHVHRPRRRQDRGVHPPDQRARDVPHRPRPRPACRAASTASPPTSRRCDHGGGARPTAVEPRPPPGCAGDGLGARARDERSSPSHRSPTRSALASHGERGSRLDRRYRVRRRRPTS